MPWGRPHVAARRVRRDLVVGAAGKIGRQPMGYAAFMLNPDLITVDPAINHGQASVTGTRIPVSVVLDCLAGGMTEDEIIAEYPSLTRAGLRAAVGYGAALAREEVLPIPQPGH